MRETPSARHGEGYLNAPFEVLASRPERIPEYQPTTERWGGEVGELPHVTYRHVFVVPRRRGRSEKPKPGKRLKNGTKVSLIVGRGGKR